MSSPRAKVHILVGPRSTVRVRILSTPNWACADCFEKGFSDVAGLSCIYYAANLILQQEHTAFSIWKQWMSKNMALFL